MIGNPEIDTVLQYPLTATYLRNLGLIGSAEERDAVCKLYNYGLSAAMNSNLNLGARFRKLLQPGCD